MEEMTPEEWVGWQAYSQHNPVSLPRRMEMALALVAKTVADSSQTLDRKKYPNGVPFDDFLPSWMKPEIKPLTVEQSTAYLVEVAAMYGATDLRGV